MRSTRLPVSIVGVELGRVLVRQRAQLQKLGRPGAGPEGSERIAGPAGAFALNRLLQRGVGIVEVGVDEFDRLVDDLVGHGAIRVEDATEIVLSVGKGVHGTSPFSTRLLLPTGIGKDALVPCRLGRGAVLTGGHVPRLVRPPTDPRPRRPCGGASARSRRCAVLRGGAAGCGSSPRARRSGGLPKPTRRSRPKRSWRERHGL